MKHTAIRFLAFGLSLMLAGCSVSPAAPRPTAASSAPTAVTEAATEPVLPTFPDGNPKDVTCKGSYTDTANLSDIVAHAGGQALTAAMLQVYYQAEAAQYRLEHPQSDVDWNIPLDAQACTADSSVRTWQQYFLRAALNRWHITQALIQQSENQPLVFEPAYQPNAANHAQYMTDIPATKVLYGHSDRYTPNSMHQAYLDAIPDTLSSLAEQLQFDSPEAMARDAFAANLSSMTQAVRELNQAYMYLTFLSYDLIPSQEEVEAYLREQDQALSQSEDVLYADVHVALLLPENSPDAPVILDSSGIVTASEAQWDACQSEADALLKRWRGIYPEREADFAEFANKNSQDTGTARNGGELTRLCKGQLIPALDDWCFAPERQAGDVTAIRTQYGYYVLYFSGSTTARYAEAEERLRTELLSQQIESAKQNCSLDVDYASIVLVPADGGIALEQLLYPDVAHERFPEVPLYLQQDYPEVKFGGSPLRSNGCGITSMSMLASYMADSLLSPPVMCDRYWRYGSSAGTDGTIFNKEPQAMGFFLREKTYEPSVAKQALEDGYIVISIQHAGYWTRGGHYIVLEKMNEDGTIQVRDSNIFNYNNSFRPAQNGHLVDKHTWGSIQAAGSGYWIFENKITRIPVCSRCGDISETNCHIFTQDYLCPKCRTALIRRQAFLNHA